MAPLVVPRHGRCPCGKACVDAHLVGDAVRDGARAEAVWRERAWEIALLIEGFEVLDIPPEFGALLNQQLKTTCPTAMAPVGRRWWFFLMPGSMEPARVARAGGVLHSTPPGPETGWVAAPGTVTESTGRIRWLVHPYLTRWQPYQRRDAVDQVFL